MPGLLFDEGPVFAPGCAVCWRGTLDLRVRVRRFPGDEKRGVLHQLRNGAGVLMNWRQKLGLWLIGGTVVSETDVARSQQEAYHTGYAQGNAVGIMQGQSQAFAEITRIVGERHPYGEVEHVDIALAKKGLVH